MKGYLKIIFYLLLVTGVMGINLPVAFSQEEQKEENVLTKEVSGGIVSVDLEKSTLVIKNLKDEKNQIYEDVTLYVDNSTTIKKNYKTISLSELTVGDEATIEYITDEEGKNKASYIWVEGLAESEK